MTSAAAAARSAASLSNQLAASMTALGKASNLTILGSQPLSGLAGQFADVATRAQGLSARMSSLAGSLDQNTTDFTELTSNLAVIAEPGRSVAALSRVPVGTTSWHALGFGVSAIELGPAELRIFGVHLSAGLSRRGERRRQVQVARLLGLIATNGGPTRAAIVGDFNAITPGDAPTIPLLPRWIRLPLRFDGGIRTEAMAALIEAGYVDAYRRLHPDLPGFTMPSVEPSVRLDYFMLGSDLVPALRTCEAMSAGAERALASGPPRPGCRAGPGRWRPRTSGELSQVELLNTTTGMSASGNPSGGSTNRKPSAS